MLGALYEEIRLGHMVISYNRGVGEVVGTCDTNSLTQRRRSIGQLHEITLQRRTSCILHLNAHLTPSHCQIFIRFASLLIPHGRRVRTREEMSDLRCQLVAQAFGIYVGVHGLVNLSLMKI